MTKSVLTGLAALAMFAGNADAHKAPVHIVRTAKSPASLVAKGGPLHDCVHITFPQCDGHGSDQPND